MNTMKSVLASIAVVSAMLGGCVLPEYTASDWRCKKGYCTDSGGNEDLDASPPFGLRWSIRGTCENECRMNTISETGDVLHCIDTELVQKLPYLYDATGVNVVYLEDYLGSCLSLDCYYEDELGCNVFIES